MKLTNAHREAFVSAVAKHLPALPDFDASTQFDEPLRKAAESILPKEVIEFAKKYPRYVDRQSFNLHYISKVDEPLFSGRRPYALSVQYIQADGDVLRAKQKAVRDEAFAVAFAVFDAWRIAKRERIALLSRLRELTNSCTSDKALRELLPEFAQFVPEEEPRVKLLPVAAGNAVIADLVKAGLKLPKVKAAA